jgi:Flp pilus assembly protein TadG
MSRRSAPLADPSSRRASEGQILVVFAMSFMVIIGMVGLSIDGGATFAQRRDQQTAADLAALAGANDYLLSNNSTQAIDRARTVSASNSFTNGVGPTTVGVAIDTSNGVEMTVSISSSHRNSFLGALGMTNWAISTEATALAGFPDNAAGAGPFIFSIGAFADDGTPKYQTVTDFGEGNSAIPTSDLDFAWTNYGTGNVNTSDVDNIIKGTLVIDKTIAYGEYVGQANNGNHNFLYDDVNTYDSGQDFPAAVVDGNGNFMGWSTFHVVSAAGGSTKHITGYFLSSYTSSRLTVSSCSSGACPRYLGSYVLKLVN